MKIGTLTVHNGYNFGASLQAYALVMALRGDDNEAYLIDYRNKCIEDRTNDSLRREKSKKLKDKLIYYIKDIFNNKTEKNKKKKYNDFHGEIIDKNIGVVYSKYELRSLNKLYDGFICGSDQIWNYNITQGDYSFFLDFADDKKLKVSYAASLGSSVLNFPHESKKYISILLNRFHQISVREEINVDEIVNLSNKDCHVVLDPVMLLSKEKWIDIAEKANVKLPNKPYIIYYQVLPDDKFYEEAKIFAKRHELDLVRMDWHPLKAWVKGCKSVSTQGIGPREFLKLILHADFVLSNSFHGTVFSIIFQKQFFTFDLCGNNVEKNKRLVQILSDVGLSNRLTRDLKNVEISEIDWEKVFNKMKGKIADSKEFLLKAIKETNEN